MKHADLVRGAIKKNQIAKGEYFYRRYQKEIDNAIDKISLGFPSSVKVDIDLSDADYTCLSQYLSDNGYFFHRGNSYTFKRASGINGFLGVMRRETKIIYSIGLPSGDK